MTDNFTANLEKYADVIVNVGLNLQDGQRLLIRSDVESAALVRAVTTSAYRHGARYVGHLLNDEVLDRIRVQYASLDSMTEFAPWMADVPAEYMDSGDAILGIRSQNPDNLRGLDADKVRVLQKTNAKAANKVRSRIAVNKSSWSLVSAPGEAWAQKIFPDAAPDDAVEQLWDAIFKICRVYEDDPVAAWQQHVSDLKKRHAYLNEKQFTALHYIAPGTDLTIGLPDDHLWCGGTLHAQNGIEFVPNLPTEEVFTLPHKDRIDGVVTATKPLSYGGKLIEDFTLKFSEGMVVNAEARVGQDALDNLLSTDEASRSLGEVALVPHSSPVSQSEILFYNTLYDENASNHIALGNAYRFTMQGGADMSDDDFANAGGNTSLSHSDFMIGSGEMDLDGIRSDGTREPVMRHGEWAFDVG